MITKAEIAIQPGVVEYTQFFEIGKDPGIKVQGEEVIEFPKLIEMKQVLLHVETWKVRDKTLVVTKATISE